MKKRIAAYVSTALITLTAASANATLLFYDGFDYTAGELLAPVASTSPGQLNPLTGYNWYNAGGANVTANKAPGIASGGLNYNDVAGYSGLPATTGKGVLFDMTQLGSARAQVTPTAISSGITYWSGLLKVGTVASMNTVNGLLLGGFNNGTGSATAAPGTVGAVLRVRGASANTYNIGTAMNSGTLAGNIQYAGTAFAEGATVFVVGAYEYLAGASNDKAYMWINPDPLSFDDASAPAPDLTSNPLAGSEFGNLISFNLRNVNTVGTPLDVIFDELRIGTTWGDVVPVIPEPGTAGLLGLGLLGLLGWRRSRSR